MFNEDDQYEDADNYPDEDDTFPDEEEDEASPEERSYEDLVKEKAPFLDDPWPPTVFILILIGFGFVLLTPPDIWSANHYYLIMTYGLILLVAVSSVISLGVWRDAAGSRLKYGGITNLIVVLICGVIGTLDTVSVVSTGNSLFPDSNLPILTLATVIVLFSLYSLWLIQRTFKTEPETPKQ